MNDTFETNKHDLQAVQGRIPHNLWTDYLSDGVKQWVGGIDEGSGQGLQEFQGVLKRDHVVQA